MGTDGSGSAGHGALTAETIKLRGTLLGNQKDLLELHRTLVRGGLLSEEEFWGGREVSAASGTGG